MGFAFKRTILAANSEAFTIMVKVDGMAIVDEMDMYTDHAFDVHAHSAELYDALCQACRGETLSILWTIEDKRGLEVWAKLFKKFNL